MVFAVSNDDDGFAELAILRETMLRKLDCLCYIGIALVTLGIDG